MSFSFEPNLIKRDSVVPIRMMVGGWVLGVAAVLMVGPVANTPIALMGLTLLAGGLVAISLRGDRMWRMLLGTSTGAIAAWIGFRFAVTERLLPARNSPFDLIDMDLLAAVTVGLSVFSIGLGGVLEAVRAQTMPGSSPTIVRIALICIGMAMTFALTRAAGVSTSIALLATMAAAAGLAAMAWLRNERPAADFVPQP